MPRIKNFGVRKFVSYQKYLSKNRQLLNSSKAFCEILKNIPL